MGASRVEPRRRYMQRRAPMQATAAASGGTRTGRRRRCGLRHVEGTIRAAGVGVAVAAEFGTGGVRLGGIAVGFGETVCNWVRLGVTV